MGQDIWEPGTEIAVRVTPKASRTRLETAPDGALRAYVTVVPEDGKANDAVRRLLAKHFGVAPGRLTLVQGTKHRDKRFRLD
ncbi:MAG: DUF167 domain-containing protein [Rhodobacteraceae bacterium]|nr:DUF167 domain-containing protein [Paracoccaceae bacterium]